MSHTVIECPGCLAKLRIRNNTQKPSIACPRCDEKISLAEFLSPQAAVGTSGTRRPKAKPARPVAPVKARPTKEPDDEFVEDFIDEDELRAKRESYIFLGVIGTAILVALIAFPSAIYYLLKDDAEDAVTQNEPPPAESAAPVAPPPAVVGSSDNQAGEVIPNAVAKDDSTAATLTDSTPADQVPKPQQPAVAATEPEVEQPAAAPPTVATPPPAKQATVTSDDQKPGKLSYHWASGQQHVYQLKIVADLGSAKQTISGSCTYTVKSDGREHDDEREGSGSGFVVAADGIIGTCAHVVEGAKRIEVTIGEQTYQASVLAEDGKLDIALIKIDAKNLPVSTFADSDKVQLAETVRAFGFPMSDLLGTGVKVATGAVAGIVMHPRHGRNIQTDAPINPGNSGGPIVNSSGHVLGIASSKISSSAASSVGFAVPVNELAKMMTKHGVTPPPEGKPEKLDGPTLAKKVTPTVAYIKVWGNSGGTVYDVDFAATFTESQSFDPRQMRFGGFPMMPSSNRENGSMKVNAMGEVVEFNGNESLPFVLGPIGQFFIEPLDPYGDDAWSSESTTSLRVIKRAPNDPVSRMRSRVPFGGPRGGMRGGFDPFGNEPKEETVKVIPATERTSWKLGPELNDRVSIHKEYEFITTQNANRPYLTMRGSGEVVFDKKLGVPASLDYKATIIQNDDDGTTDKLPITVSYTLRDPEDIKREREAALARVEAQRKQQKEEQTKPNPELVDELLAEIRKAEGGLGARSHLERLARIALVEKKRDDVLKVANNHRQNSSDFVRAAAAELFCRWSPPDQVDEFWKIVDDSNHLLNGARKVAITRLIEAKAPELYPRLIKLMTNSSLRRDIKLKLIEAGEPAEEAVLNAVAAGGDSFVRRDLLEVLQKVGTEKSIETLKDIATGSDFSMKHPAQRALDAIRARL